jgi:hypothetical protein
MTRLNANFDKDLWVTNKVGLQISTHTLDLQFAGGDVHLISAMDRTKRTVLEWLGSADVNDAGLFSAVCKVDKLIACAEEAVRSDLELLALLQERTGDLLAKDATLPPKATLRETVRRQLIRDMVLDRSISGNVLSLERLQALERALPALAKLHRASSATDSVVGAAVPAYINMLRVPGGLPRQHLRSHNYSPIEVEWFNDEVATAFALFGELPNFSGELPLDERARKMRTEWLRELREGEVKLMADERAVRQSFTEDAFAPFAPNKFGVEVLEKELARGVAEPDRERILLAALKQARARLTGFSLLIDQDKPNGSDMLSQMARSRELVEPVVDAIASHLDLVSPTARVVFEYELAGLRATMLRASAFQLADRKEMERALYAVDDLDEWVALEALSEGKDVPERIREYTGDCSWSDRTFRAHFIVQIQLLLNAKYEDLQRVLVPLALPRLWLEYGPEGKCPNFIPGVALLHGMLVLGKDARTEQTRRQLDSIAGADPAWLKMVFRWVRRAEAYEGRSLEARIIRR